MKFVMLGSGRGSNAEALLRAWQQGQLGSAQPAAIFSDKPDARILELGPTFGIEARYLDPGRFKTKLTPEAEQELVDAIRATGAELIVLAGYMRVIKEPFLNAFPRRIINLHPSLLPSFKGLNGIGQAYDYGVKITGCTVHWVTGELDGGPIIDQEPVRIEPGDTLEAVEAKVHAAEHRLLPQVVRQLADEWGR
ncbi:MAG: phosphoribosylglycinamide formyltransferase 1 [Puniceicoccaceae bacterium 5H]|nr:MAG: phosphoribosylglycinamide formyltransferase 1 [Puniceicoccaceae bacterium 5H]